MKTTHNSASVEILKPKQKQTLNTKRNKVHLKCVANRENRLNETTELSRKEAVQQAISRTG